MIVLKSTMSINVSTKIKDTLLSFAKNINSESPSSKAAEDKEEPLLEPKSNENTLLWHSQPYAPITTPSHSPNLQHQRGLAMASIQAIERWQLYTQCLGIRPPGDFPWHEPEHVEMSSHVCLKHGGFWLCGDRRSDLRGLGG